MKLYYTPRSHFSRKVRVLLDAWRLDCELIDVGDVGGRRAGDFGPNPLMKVPTLVDGQRWIIDSDHIAGYLARQHDPRDTFGVTSGSVEQLNARAVMNGVMAAEVELLLARRAGIDVASYERFDKILAAIRASLGWLDDHAASFSGPPSYLGFHLVCMWDHLAFYETVELGYPGLRELIAGLSGLPYVAASAPR